MHAMCWESLNDSISQPIIRLLGLGNQEAWGFCYFLPRPRPSPASAPGQAG